VRESHGAPLGAAFNKALRRAWPAVVGGLIAIGVLLRLRQYLARRSLWLDELSIALNLASRGFVDLLRPLDYNQAAPVLFLWVQELASRIGGLGELSLRFAPLLCGIALLPVAWVAARRLLEPWAAACVVLLLAVSPLLVWHANEVKPYAGDALASAVMIVLALRTIEAPADGSRWRWLAAGGFVALLGSTPAVFVLGGVALALALVPGVWRDRRAIRRAALLLAFWGASFAAVYLAIYRPVSDTGYLQRYWAKDFLRLDASLPAVLWQETRTFLARAFLSGLRGTGLTIAAGIAIGIVVMGVVYLARRRGVPTVALLIGPLALAFGAAVVQSYPVDPRLYLFAVPPTALLLLAGVSAFEVRRGPAMRLIGFAALFGLSVLSSGWRLARAPMQREETRPVLEAYQRLERNEPVLVFGDGMKSWVYYTLDWNRPDSARLNWPKTPAGPLRGPDGLAWRGQLPRTRRPLANGWSLSEGERTRLIASPCAWLFFAHYKQPQVDSLLEGIVKAGGSVRQEAMARGSQLHRACFERNAGSRGLR
jgi:4-amino-4-deoxy-L-arabinose transferase-like glycosyltransferase